MDEHRLALFLSPSFTVMLKNTVVRSFPGSAGDKNGIFATPEFLIESCASKGLGSRMKFYDILSQNFDTG